MTGAAITRADLRDQAVAFKDVTGGASGLPGQSRMPPRLTRNPELLAEFDDGEESPVLVGDKSAPLLHG